MDSVRWLFIVVLAVAWGLVIALDRWFPMLSMAAISVVVMIIYALMLGLGEISQRFYKDRLCKKYTPEAPQTSALQALYPAQAERTAPEKLYLSPNNKNILPPAKVSVFIPACNEESVIEAAVRMVWALDYPALELIVIDDRSSDDTPNILRRLLATNRLATKPVPFQVLFRKADSTPGKAAALNEAMALASGDVIAVFDADALVAPDFISQLMPYLQQPDVAAVQARKVIINETQDLLTRAQAYEYTLDAQLQCGRDALRSAVEIRGNGFLLRRDALDSVGGFTESSVTDDLDLSTKLHVFGWDIRFAPEVTVLEEAVPTFGALIRQRVRWAEGSLSRYLMYAPRMFSEIHKHPRVILDMLVYFTQFLFPLWVISDYLLMGWELLAGHAMKEKILSTAVIMPLLFCFFLLSTSAAIRRFYHRPWLKCIGWAGVVGVYMPLLWLPVMFWVMAQMALLPRRQFYWEKTSHRGVASREALAPLLQTGDAVP
ncbi:MAG: glycosyltransferase family 2 protein [Vampirovibrionales bacterium]|nr:glycosyltransferase family 2 protein [Vampirovibrionales bacterium]